MIRNTMRLALAWIVVVTCHDVLGFVIKHEDLSINLNVDLEVCFGELGCFSTGGDFAERHLNFLPQSPASISTNFTLHTHRNYGQVIQLSAGDLNALHNNSVFNPEVQSILIVHGFLENVGVGWVGDMRSALLLQGDYNVIEVDWSGGAGIPYTQATANTRVVGAQIAELIKFVCEHSMAEEADFHIIGHSLGAHIAGYAGHRLNDLGRITGLDPAGPYFEDFSPVVRLDESDARLVDVIHTNGKNLINVPITRGGFGVHHNVGDVDFYPNGGKEQPNCNNFPVEEMFETSIEDMTRYLLGILTTVTREFITCSHIRVLDLLTESILAECPFLAYPCQDWQTFHEGRCLDCSSGDCGHMGFHAAEYATSTQHNRTLYLQTGGEQPFCRYHYGVTVTLRDRPGETHRGWLRVLISGENGHSVYKKITNTPDSESAFDIAPGSSYYALVTDPVDIGAVTSVKVWWECDGEWWDLLSHCYQREATVNVEAVQVVQGERQIRSQFCAEDVDIISGQSQNLARDSCQQ